MKLWEKQFLGNDACKARFKDCPIAVVPFCYEGGVSYGKGAAQGPAAIIDASCQVELYDEFLDTEPYQTGICTVAPPDMPEDPEEMSQTVEQVAGELLKDGKFVVSIGGDHSITPGYVKALKQKHGNLSVIQFDAHADLRDSYDGSKMSHACVMARVREMTTDTLQLGVRSMSAGEARRIKDENIAICTMREIHTGSRDMDKMFQALPDPVFITFDVDVFDWSVVRSTGTPEPGGMTWDEAVLLLDKIFKTRNVVGFDVVELAADENDPNSAFAVAKLLYRMIGLAVMGLG